MLIILYFLGLYFEPSFIHAFFLCHLLTVYFCIQSDPIGEVLVATFPGSERRQLLTADQVTMDHEGLMNLIVRTVIIIAAMIMIFLTIITIFISLTFFSFPPLQHNGCYHEALRLTSLVLSAHGQGINQIGCMTVHTHKTLQVTHRLIIIINNY